MGLSRFDPGVAVSEKKTGYLNRALANFLKSFNNLENEPEEVLDIYFNQCSLAMNCIDLAKSAIFLANDGRSHGLHDANDGPRVRIQQIRVSVGAG